MDERQQGLIHVYTGDGKGKTTAALGMALRAAGHGWRTFMGQFLKGQDYGELEGARLLGDRLVIRQFGRPAFIRAGHAAPQDIRLAQEGLSEIREAMLGGHYQMVVLDEINVAILFGLLSVADVLALLDARPPSVELVLTGRRVPKEIAQRADYVTEMREIKHPYQQGVQARKGIEF